MVLGGSQAGKSALIKAYLYNRYSETRSPSLQNTHYRQKKVEGVKLDLEIYEQGESPEYNKYSGTDIFLLLFSCEE